MPKWVTILLIVTVISMNLLSNITILSLPWLALTAGITVSWLVFLLMDITTKHFGAKPATILSIIAIIANTIFCLVCFVISKIGTYPKLDMILGGQWSILLASTTAYVVSAITNNYLNAMIGSMFKNNPDSKLAYITRTYISTFIGQFVDNFLFVVLAFVVLPLIPSAIQVHWTILQCVGCSLSCAFLEFLCEAIFSPLGYKISQKWKKENIGATYIEKYCSER